MFEELSTSIKATLYERAKKPFTGAFALSWCIINWKIIATLFFVSEEYLKDKTRIDHIQENYIGWADNFWLPLLISSILILLLPFFNLIALSIKQVYKKIEFKNILKKQPIDAENYAELLDNQNKQQQKFTEQIQSLNSSLQKQKDVFIKLNQNHSKLLIENEGLNKNIKNLEDELKGTIKRAGHSSEKLNNAENKYNRLVSEVKSIQTLIHYYKSEHNLKDDETKLNLFLEKLNNKISLLREEFLRA